jgi:23S rRNA (cytosine1962-C5)-methyltransferase
MEPAPRAVAPPKGHVGPLPWVKLRSAASGHQLYKRMMDLVDPRARPGDVVMVYDKSDAPYGLALYNPRSQISLRLMHRGRYEGDLDQFFAERIKAAFALRRDVYGLDAVTNAYRLVHDMGDGLPGIVIDRYDDVFVLDYYSLGMVQQSARIERAIQAIVPGAVFVKRASEHNESMEGFKLKPNAPVKRRITENGVLFEVMPSGGYKTGFFCDQRDNRLAFGKLAAGKRVMDVCSYTGGFGIYAAKNGAREVTSVELDPDNVAMLKRNANINQVRVEAVTVDAFPYLRQKAQANDLYDLVVLDPYKLINSAETYDFGRKKYNDLNRLGMSCVAKGGILVTCSCSGMLPWHEFQQVIRTAAGAAGRRVQILRKTGAGVDHPVAADHPEGEYLKVIWCRVL